MQNTGGKGLQELFVENWWKLNKTKWKLIKITYSRAVAQRVTQESNLGISGGLDQILRRIFAGDTTDAPKWLNEP